MVVIKTIGFIFSIASIFVTFTLKAISALGPVKML